MQVFEVKSQNLALVIMQKNIGYESHEDLSNNLKIKLGTGHKVFTIGWWKINEISSIQFHTLPKT